MKTAALKCVSWGFTWDGILRAGAVSWLKQETWEGEHITSHFCGHIIISILLRAACSCCANGAVKQVWKDWDMNHLYHTCLQPLISGSQSFSLQKYSVLSVSIITELFTISLGVCCPLLPDVFPGIREQDTCLDRPVLSTSTTCKLNGSCNSVLVPLKKQNKWQVKERPLSVCLLRITKVAP